MERADQPGVINATVVWVDLPSQRAMDLPQWMRDIVA